MKHSRFGRFKHTVEAPEHGERENDASIFRLFIIATKEVSNGPDEGREILLAHKRVVPTWSMRIEEGCGDLTTVEPKVET